MAGSTPNPDRLAFSKAEAARQVGLSVRSFHDLLRTGQIPFVRAGRRVLIPRAGLEAWLARAAESKQEGHLP